MGAARISSGGHPENSLNKLCLNHLRVFLLIALGYSVQMINFKNLQIPW
jgi:hypothetical protein